MENGNEERSTITMFDTQTGAGTEMIIADTAEMNGSKYLLVYEREDEEEAEASVLKEINESEEDIYYEQITDENELESIIALFGDSGFDYTIRF